MQLHKKINQPVAKKEDAKECFNIMKKKYECALIKFDICDFYPSFTERLLMAAIKVAKNYCPIKDQEMNIINPAHTPVLFHNDCLWTKTNNTEFNIAMSAYDS